nr:MAG TPA: hypothetical protein [Caudoviricetes sp.]
MRRKYLYTYLLVTKNKIARNVYIPTKFKIAQNITFELYPNNPIVNTIKPSNHKEK